MSKPEPKESPKVVPFEKPKSDAGDEGAAGIPQPPAMDTGASANIDKIRDIIFGNQMTDYEKRFGRLEERMFKEMTVSKSEARENFDSLEKQISKELESLKNQVIEEQGSRSESLKNVERKVEDISRALKDQITNEKNARSESFRDLERQLKDNARTFEKRTDKLEELLNQNAMDIRQEISETARTLRNEMRQKHEETAATIERIAHELRANKVDRSSLSDFFSEMAMRLTNERG